VVTWRAVVATPLRARAAVARSAAWAAARASGDATAQVPYFVWVSIATVLQLLITWMNRAQRSIAGRMVQDRRGCRRSWIAFCSSRIGWEAHSGWICERAILLSTVPTFRFIPDYRSTLYSGEGIDLDITSGPYGIRIRNAISEPSLEFCTLPIARRASSPTDQLRRRDSIASGSCRQSRIAKTSITEPVTS